MKLTVEFELDDSWQDYIPDDNEKLKQLIRHDLQGVKVVIVKNEDEQSVKQLNKSYISGQRIINYVVFKLKNKGIPPEDTCILTELRLLTSYELKQIL